MESYPTSSGRGIMITSVVTNVKEDGHLWSAELDQQEAAASGKKLQVANRKTSIVSNFINVKGQKGKEHSRSCCGGYVVDLWEALTGWYDDVMRTSELSS